MNHRPLLFLLAALLLFSGCRKPEYPVIPVVDFKQIGEINSSYYHYNTDALHFTDEMHGVYGGYRYLGYTDDGGTSWNMLFNSISQDYRVVNISQAGNTLFAFFDYTNSWSDTIYSSTDNGQHWQPISSGTNLLAGQAISATSFFKVAHTSTSLSSPVGLYYSSNAGTSWSAVPIPPNYPIEGLYFSSPSTGVIFGSYTSSMYYTSDGGVSWQAVATDYIAISNLKRFGNRLFASSSESGRSSEIIYSDDLGLNWEPATLNNSGIYPNMGSLQDLAISADGTMGCSVLYGVFLSADNGLNWEYHFDAGGSNDYEYDHRFVKVIITPGKRILALTQQGEFYQIIQ